MKIEKETYEVTRTRYIAKDGSSFTYRTECEDWENALDAMGYVAKEDAAQKKDGVQQEKRPPIEVPSSTVLTKINEIQIQGLDMSLSERMKAYENVVPDATLLAEMPVIIRLDGCYFHTFTHGFTKPFDNVMTKAMAKTMFELCKDMPYCAFGYTQSDEISLIIDMKGESTGNGYYGLRVQKLCSVVASRGSRYFNRFFEEECEAADLGNSKKSMYQKKYKQADFDARVFNLPYEEVANYLIYRQGDSIRNSIQATAQHHFSHKELKGKDREEQLAMLLAKGVDWDRNFSKAHKVGIFAYRVEKEIPTKSLSCGFILRKKWTMDWNMPRIVDDREYINQIIPPFSIYTN